MPKSPEQSAQGTMRFSHDSRWGGAPGEERPGTVTAGVLLSPGRDPRRERERDDLLSVRKRENE